MLAPIHRPFKNKIIRVITGLHIPTAARASLPTNWPTIILSTALYVSWNKLPRTNGIVNPTRRGIILPFVKSLVIINLLSCP